MPIPSGYTSGQIVQAVPSLSAYAVTSSTRPATPFDGQIISETDTDTLQVYKGSAWGNPSGLVLVKSQTIGTTVSSITVSDAFNANYDNYKILIVGGTSSAECTLNMALGASATGYHAGGRFTSWQGTGGSDFNQDNGTSFQRVGYARPDITMNFDVIGPFLTQITRANSLNAFSSTANLGSAVYFHNVSASYTAFTLTTSTGTLTGGTIRVYGYTNS